MGRHNQYHQPYSSSSYTVFLEKKVEELEIEVEKIYKLEAKVEELEAGIRDHIEWADTAVDCDDLKILVGDMQEDE